MPRPLRNRVLVCMILGALVGFGAFGSLEESFAQTTPSIEPDASRPEWVDKMAKASLLARFNAVASMRISRGILSGLLGLASALVVVSGLRMLRPVGISRTSAASFLSRAAFGAAILETLIGAQDTVIAQRTGLAYAKLALAEFEGLEAYWVPSMIATQVAITILMAGGLLLLSRYFRSEKVKQLVAFMDRQTA
jgi:hypothetical protein